METKHIDYALTMRRRVRTEEWLHQPSLRRIVINQKRAVRILTHYETEDRKTTLTRLKRLNEEVAAEKVVQHESQG